MGLASMAEQASLPDPAKLLSGRDVRTAFEGCAWGSRQRRSVEFGWPSFSAYHYANKSDYNQFIGDNLTPHNAKSYASKTSWARLRQSTQPPLETSFCELPQSDGSTWHIQRVGPFVSTGGYDWWQMQAEDAFALRRAIAAHGSVGCLEYYMGPISGDGNGMGYPPLHPHHIHVTPWSGS